MACKHATESLTCCLQVGDGSDKLPGSSGVVTALTEDAQPLIRNKGDGQFILTCGQDDIADAPPAVKLTRSSPRPVIATALQKEAYSGRWVALSGHQASGPSDRKPNLDLPTAH
jgi:hypothetical protein